MNVMLVVCGVIAVVGIVLAVAFMPQRVERSKDSAEAVASPAVQAGGEH